MEEFTICIPHQNAHRIIAELEFVKTHAIPCSKNCDATIKEAHSKTVVFPELQNASHRACVDGMTFKRVSSPEWHQNNLLEG
mmetsp:Transcript_18530/g.37437  ORF Transcript_18530/g.37437 Transcript_18530/m.37437 type:complete len:82 (-) Transcript_18530:642-887(-)